MDVTPLVPADRPLIRSYGDGGFAIQGVRWRGSILILADKVLSWPVTDMEAFSLDGLAPVLDSRPLPELLLVGCGAAMILLQPTLRAELRAAGLVVETMDTGAACRTWNVLLAEGRNAAAAMIAV